MKMSEEFNLPLMPLGTDEVHNADETLEFFCDQAEAAALAINSYDGHVSRIADLEEVLRRQLLGLGNLIELEVINPNYVSSVVTEMEIIDAALDQPNSVKGEG